MDRNQPINNLQTWLFEPAEESTCFPRGPLEWVMEMKNVNSSYIFDLGFEIAGRWQNNSLCQRKMCPGYCMQSLLFFTSCWLAHNQLSWNVLLVSCNPIGQLCLRGLLGYLMFGNAITQMICFGKMTAAGTKRECR